MASFQKQYENKFSPQEGAALWKNEWAAFYSDALISGVLLALGYQFLETENHACLSYTNQPTQSPQGNQLLYQLFHSVHSLYIARLQTTRGGQPCTQPAKVIQTSPLNLLALLAFLLPEATTKAPATPPPQSLLLPLVAPCLTCPLCLGTVPILSLDPPITWKRKPTF